MKRIKLFTVVVALFFGSQVSTLAQDTTYFQNEYGKSLAVYQLSQRYNDALVTKQALYELLVLNDRDTTVLRSLAELYYGNRQYTSSALVGLDFLEKYPMNLIALEVVALSYEQLRLYDKAVEYYEKIWLQTENVNILYQTAYLQHLLKRHNEAKTNLNIVDSQLTDEDKIQLSKQDGSVQDVPFKAAVLNLRGLISLDQENSTEARNFFNQALELAPDFEAPKNALANLN